MVGYRSRAILSSLRRTCWKYSGLRRMSSTSSITGRKYASERIVPNGGASAGRDRLGHFWKAEAGQFWRAPKASNASCANSLIYPQLGVV